MAMGSMAMMSRPTTPNREPPEEMRTTRLSTLTRIRTGMTPTMPFLTTLRPELVEENSPSVSEPKRAGIR